MSRSERSLNKEKIIDLKEVFNEVVFLSRICSLYMWLYYFY